MIERMDKGPCLCGDPECPNCFPSYYTGEEDDVPTLSEARLPTDKAIGDACAETVRQIATPVAPLEIYNPKWITSNMTVETAAREADMRGFVLKPHWDPTMGLSIKVVSKL